MWTHVDATNAAHFAGRLSQPVSSRRDWLEALNIDVLEETGAGGTMCHESLCP